MVDGLSVEYKPGKTPTELGTFTFVNNHPSYRRGTIRHTRMMATAELLTMMMDGCWVEYHEVNARTLKAKVHYPNHEHPHHPDPLARACRGVFGKGTD